MCLHVFAYVGRRGTSVTGSPRTPTHIGTGEVSGASGHHAEEPINVKDRHGVQLSHGCMIHDGKLFQCTEMIE